MNLDRIIPRIVVGSYPESPADIHTLRHALGITAVLNVQTDEDHEYLGVDWPRLEALYRDSNVVVRRVPVKDFDPDDLSSKLPQGVAALRDLLAAGHDVYVHCTAGMGRSPNMVIAYLHWVAGWELSVAADHVNQVHPCSADLTAIRLATAEFDACWQ